jgi:hypothetical protein
MYTLIGGIIVLWLQIDTQACVQLSLEILGAFKRCEQEIAKVTNCTIPDQMRDRAQPRSPCCR